MQARREGERQGATVDMAPIHVAFPVHAMTPEEFFGLPDLIKIDYPGVGGIGPMEPRYWLWAVGTHLRRGGMMPRRVWDAVGPGYRLVLVVWAGRTPCVSDSR